eukprot:jgi/Astpho2/9355/Aster-07293
MLYWLVSAPECDGSKERTWNLVQQKTTYEHDFSINYKFTLPELRVGTLDSLLVLSDDLVKVNSMMEAVVNKVRRQLYDVQSASTSDDTPAEPQVEGISPSDYIEKFSWDEAKYPPRRPLGETVSMISETVQKLEDELKVRMQEYNQVKGQLGQISRKQTGSLAVRDLSSLVQGKDFVNTENLVTLFVVVSKHTKGDWLTNYEKLCEFVVPRSSKQVAEDNDYTLFSVTLFRRVVDTFKSTARTRGFQVREQEVSKDGQQASQEQTGSLQKDVEGKRSQLEQWCGTAYGEAKLLLQAFSAWIHICAVRLFVESILRYGLPPKFLAVLMKPNIKASSKLRKLLATLFNMPGTEKYYDDKEGNGNTGGEGEMYPYVSFNLSLE